jgi:hypothetical protein
MRLKTKYHLPGEALTTMLMDKVRQLPTAYTSLCHLDGPFCFAPFSRKAFAISRPLPMRSSRNRYPPVHGDVFIS